MLLLCLNEITKLLVLPPGEIAPFVIFFGVHFILCFVKKFKQVKGFQSSYCWLLVSTSLCNILLNFNQTSDSKR